MKSRKFATFAEAIQYLEERGTLKYFGREGHDFEYCVYNFVCRGITYHLSVYIEGEKTGLVRIRE